MTIEDSALTTPATSASTPRPEDRMVDGVERADHVRDRFLAVGTMEAKKLIDSKRKIIDDSTQVFKTGGDGLLAQTTRNELKCKSGGTAYQGDLDIPSYVSELREGYQKTTDFRILGYSQTMTSEEAAKKAYTDTAKDIRDSSLYKDLKANKINTELDPGITGITGAAAGAISGVGYCGRFLLEELEKLAKEFGTKQPDDELFNERRTDQLRNLKDDVTNNKIDLNDASVQEALASLSEPPPTPEEVAQQKRFDEQCFLLRYMDIIPKIPGTSTISGVPKVFKLGSEFGLSPDGFVNQLIKPANYEQIFNITPAQLSSLTPSIELYKVFVDDSGKEADIPIVMNTHVTSDEINSFLGNYSAAGMTPQTYELQKSRGIGAGLKSMTMEFDGNNFFTAKRNIKSKLKLFFASFEELLRSRTVFINESNGPAFESAPKTFRFIDLMMKTPSAKQNQRKTHQLDPNPRDYRLKAVFGWSELQGTQLISDFTSTQKQIKDALKNASITVQLIPVTHTINVGENGQVEVEIEYRAYIDSITGAVYSNILATTELYKKLFEFEDILFRARSQGSGCKNEQINAFKKNATEEIDVLEEKALTSIITSLADTGKIISLTVKHEDVKNPGNVYQLDVTQFSQGGNVTNIESAIKKATKDAVEAKDGTEPPSASELLIPELNEGYQIISYMYLSDILDVIIAKIEDSLEKNKNIPSHDDIQIQLEQFKKIRIILGPSIINLPIPGGGSTQQMEINIGDIPISLVYFTEFLMSKTIKEGISQYTLFQFLSDFMNDFVRNIFSPEKCLGGDSDHKLILRNAVVTSKTDLANGVPTSFPILEQSKRSNSGDEFTYLIYYATTRVPLLFGDREKDHAKGIYHFDIGANSGLVKNISFSKAEQKYVKEARFERDGVDGLGQLREAYDITIQMYGNVQLYPGMYIFVNPVGISPSLGNPTDSGSGARASISHLLGIGGYHLITKVDSIIAEGQFDTTITAKWVSSGAKREDNTGINAGASSACKVEEVRKAKTTSDDS